MSANVHSDPDDTIRGKVSHNGGRTYGVLEIERKRGYGSITLFMGDTPTATRNYVANLRAALSDIISSLPKEG